MIPDFTTVVGVDAKHLDQFRITWPTWKKHKSSLLSKPMWIFYDQEQVDPEHIRLIVDHPFLTLFPWPPDGTEYEGTSGDKWGCPQRHKMLAGFVHVPYFIETLYWLKLDTDTIASGMDNWIDESWFEDDPAIVAHRWSFTKPADQIEKLDKWVEDNPGELKELAAKPPLDMHPKPGSNRIGHKRIISWCGFFNTAFTRQCSVLAYNSCGRNQIPVPSQDGYLWYCATRLGLPIKRINAKNRGWVHRSSAKGIKEAVSEAMKNGK